MRRKPLKCECVLEYMSEAEARQLAAAEGLTLVPSEHSATGWYGVFLALGRNRPYMAHIKGTGIREYLGRYTTEWEAALIVARRLGPAVPALGGRGWAFQRALQERRLRGTADG